MICQNILSRNPKCWLGIFLFAKPKHMFTQTTQKNKKVHAHLQWYSFQLSFANTKRHFILEIWPKLTHRTYSFNQIERSRTRQFQERSHPIVTLERFWHFRETILENEKKSKKERKIALRPSIPFHHFFSLPLSQIFPSVLQP